MRVCISVGVAIEYTRNPCDVCLLYGFGVHNAPHSWSAGNSLRGGISNGITGADGADDGAGIQFGSGRDSENWRWYEQWIPHASWFLLAVAAGTASRDVAIPAAR